jgi:integrase
MFNSRLKDAFGHLRLNAIKRVDVERFHVNLRKDRFSPATGDHYAKLLRHVLNLAVDWEVIDSNPLARIKLFRESNHIERYMDDDELARLMFVLKYDENRPVANIATFLLSTGARLNEALTARWENIDIEHRTWRVTAEVSNTNCINKLIFFHDLNES